MEEVKRIALFGGSFDPVTNAHRDIIAKLAERFDKVIVMPAAISPFKTNALPSASGEQRVDMLKRACRGIEGVTVSRYELKHEGVSYTVDTIEHLIKKYAAEVFTVIGSEELKYLDKWKDAAKLKEITTFYVIERGGFAAGEQAIKARSLGWRVRVAPFAVGSDSSSLVKIARAFGRDKLPVPSGVAKYIVKNDLYEDYRYITDRYEEFGLKRERVRHIERVAYYAAYLAKRYGVSVHDAVTAALLHDIAKATDESWFKREGLKAPDVSGMPSQIRHAVYGAEIARSCFLIDNEEILDAIRLHTTGGENMSKLAEVIFLADYCEEGREFDGVEEIRLAANESLEKGMYAALCRTIAFIRDGEGELYGATENACEYYKNLVEKKKRKPAKKSEPKTEKSSRKVKRAEDIAPSKTSEETPETTAKVTKTPVAEEAAESETPTTSEEETETEEPEPPETEAFAAPKETPEHKAAHVLAGSIGGFLSEKRGRDILLIDVSERTVVTDYFVIATATSTTQVRALADYVDEKLSKGSGLEPLHRDSNPQWYVMDYGSVIVHIMLPSVREVYSLEHIWSDGANEERIDK